MSGLVVRSDSDSYVFPPPRALTNSDYRAKIVDRPDARPLVVDNGAVRFDEVHFAYVEGIPALRGVTIEARAGQKIALVGPSGAGKSTVLNLLLRFHDATGGSVTIDGQDLRAVTTASLRRAIALVSQETGLFNTSVRDNIAYGDPDADEAAIIDAAKAAAAHEFITALPDGYDTMVGERGLRLSGGQRQRLSIARAMLRDAPILLLDEATSSLDTQSERQVQRSLKRKIPLIYASVAGFEPVTWRWKGQLSENSKVLAFGNVFPELNHNEIMGWGPLDEINEKFQVIYLRDRGDDLQTNRRMELTRKIVEKHTGDSIVEVKSQGEALLTRLFSLVLLGDMVSLYLAIENQVDPTLIENINFLKQGLLSA